MANDLVIQLLLKTGAFSNDLKTAKGQIQNFQNSCSVAGKGIDSFTKGLGLNVASLAKFNLGLAAAATAGKILKDGITQNADVMDEIARKTDTAKAAWANFTNAIVNGGAFASFKELRKEVREAYDAFDNWNVANKSINIVLSVSENQYKRLLEVARDVSLADVDRLEALSQASALMQRQIDMQRSLAALDKKRSKEALDAALAKKGVTSYNQDTLTRFLDIDSNGQYGFDKHLDQYKESSERLKRTWKKAGGIYALAQALHDISRDEEKGYQILKDYIQNNIYNYGSDLADYNEQHMKTEIERLRKEITGRKTTTTTTKPVVEENKPAEGSLQYWKDAESAALRQRDALVKGTEEWNNYNKKLLEARDNIEKLSDKVAEVKVDEQGIVKAYMDDTANSVKYSANELNNLISIFTKWRDELKEGDPLVAKYSEEIEKLKKRLEELRGTSKTTNPADSLQDMKIKADNLSSALGSVNTMFGSLSQAASAFGSETGDAFSTVLDSLGSVAQGIQQFVQIQQAAAMASGTASASGLPFPYNLAAIATVVSTIASVFANIKRTAGNFATGGIVGGNSFTGDRLTANVNSGEMILNRSQQAKLFRQINNGGGAGQVQFHISGTDLVGVLNNNYRKARLTR